MTVAISKDVNALRPFQVCTVCGVGKPTSRDNFGTKENGYPRPRCRACARNATNKHARNNPELGRERARRRQARAESVGPVGAHREARDFLLIEQEYRCYFCETHIDEYTAEIDHLTPIARGGDNEIENLSACCRACNRAKRDRTEAEFRDIRANRYQHYG